MAKRTPRPEAGDGAAETPGPAAKSRRARPRGAKAATESATGGQVTADDPAIASAPALGTTHAARPDPAVRRPPEDTIAADPRVPEANHYEQVREPTREEIQRRAYELYVLRGARHGLAEDDWYRAERELRNRIRR